MAKNMKQEQLYHKIHALLGSRKLAVLSTCGPGGPYASLVAFHFSSDLRCVYFATTRATRKYANLMQHPEVAFLINNSSNRMEDFHKAAAVTIIGQAEEFDEKEKMTAADSYLARHPYLHDFIAAPTTAFFAVKAKDYIYVSRFQEVLEYRIDHDPDSST